MLARPVDDCVDQPAAEPTPALLRRDPHPDQMNRAGIVCDEAADDRIEVVVPLHGKRRTGCARRRPLLPHLVRERLLFHKS